MVLGPLLCGLLGLLCKPEETPPVNVIKVDSLPAAPSKFACFLDPIAGSCDGINPRYYFDFKTGHCEQFNYGGCGGNMNNFETLGDCLDYCATFMYLAEEIKKKKDKGSNGGPCSLERDPGPCEAAFPRFYFDSASETCKPFTYGGCQGNDNNFVTVDDCIAKCGSSCYRAADPGPCRGNFYRYAYDYETKSCKKFIYGGCKGNDNNFKSKEECMSSCGDTKDKVEDKGGEEEPTGMPEKCEQEPLTGPCGARFFRYYFNPENERCEVFVYGGCQGNDNNFVTLQECNAQCGRHAGKTGNTGGGKKSKGAVCSKPSKKGPCKAIILRYYYNPDAKKCEIFFYGGCRSNGNNFKTQEECNAECVKTDEEEEEGRVIKEDHCKREEDDPYAICALPSDPGPCEAAIKRYYYNHDEKKCQQFRYGGCQGNANNFETPAECELECGLSH